jgi:hypothetical protein
MVQAEMDRLNNRVAHLEELAETTAQTTAENTRTLLHTPPTNDGNTNDMSPLAFPAPPNTPASSMGDYDSQPSSPHMFQEPLTTPASSLVDNEPIPTSPTDMDYETDKDMEFEMLGKPTDEYESTPDEDTEKEFVQEPDLTTSPESAMDVDAEPFMAEPMMDMNAEQPPVEPMMVANEQPDNIPDVGPNAGPHGGVGRRTRKKKNKNSKKTKGKKYIRKLRRTFKYGARKTVRYN